MIFVLSACRTSAADSQAAQGTTSITPGVIQSATPVPLASERRMMVFAAASLTDAFMELGQEFEAAHPGVQVDFSFAGSQILRTQLEQGAVADIVALADEKNMQLLLAEGLVARDATQDFTANRMIVILPPGNPGQVHTLLDLTRPHLKLVLADGSVPAGDYARQILANLSKDPSLGIDFSSKVLANLVSNETDVKQVVTKVELGEADAGIVYVSDAIAAKDLITIPIADQYNVIARYPIAVLAHSPNPDLASEFVAYITSTIGQSVLSRWGFSSTSGP